MLYDKKIRIQKKKKIVKRRKEINVKKIQYLRKFFEKKKKNDIITPKLQLRTCIRSPCWLLLQV